MTSGPAMLRDEDGLLTGYVYVDVAGRDLGSYVEEAQRVVREHDPAARRLLAFRGAASTRPWSASRSGSTVVLPLTLFLIFMLLYVNTRSMAKTLIVVLAVPFSAVGAIWFLYLLGYNMSIGGLGRV